jgi:hypothetical protein
VGRAAEGQGLSGAGWVATAVAIGRRPGLWLTAARQVLVLAPRRWWRVAPHVPWPAPGYLRFRLVTQYGDPDHQPDPADVVAYLAWCKSMRRRRRAA